MTTITSYIKVTLEATDPGALLQEQTPENIWLRSSGPGGGFANPMITIMGPLQEVLLFVDKWWEIMNIADDREDFIRTYVQPVTVMIS